MATNEINPFVDLIGQPVPPVDPQVLKNAWNSGFTFFAEPMPAVKELSVLELVASTYQIGAASDS